LELFGTTLNDFHLEDSSRFIEELVLQIKVKSPHTNSVIAYAGRMDSLTYDHIKKNGITKYPDFTFIVPKDIFNKTKLINHAVKTSSRNELKVINKDKKIKRIPEVEYI
jgi:hypothetical protein